MANLRLEVFWSPNNPEKFLTWGSEITLYQVENISPGDDIPTRSKFINFYRYPTFNIDAIHFEIF